MPDRFYLASLQERPAYWGDLGHRITIAGLVLQGTDQPILVHLPESDVQKPCLTELRPTAAEWSEIIKHSDDPEIFEHDKTGCLKAVHRKVRYSISGFVQQKVWVADNFECKFCFRKMGHVQLTIDHFMPLELGGLNSEINFISACRKCNKQKGGLHPKDWCNDRNLNYQEILDYLKNRKLLA